VAAESETKSNMGKVMVYVCSAWRCPHHLERVLRYLKGAMSYGIHYTGYPSVLEGYCDAN
jgi:hypothetical protein